MYTNIDDNWFVLLKRDWPKLKASRIPTYLWSVHVFQHLIACHTLWFFSSKYFVMLLRNLVCTSKDLAIYIHLLVVLFSFFGSKTKSVYVKIWLLSCYFETLCQECPDMPSIIMAIIVYRFLPPVESDLYFYIPSFQVVNRDKDKKARMSLENMCAPSI